MKDGSLKISTAQLREVYDAAVIYFQIADANHPPQTREEFERACELTSYARERLRTALETSADE